jgi:hypothetical protein
MTVRSLDILDLPLLSQYHRDVLPLDSARLMTRGNPLGAMALLSYLNPRRNIYTAVASQDSNTLMGQVTLHEEETSARLTFLAPAENANELVLPLVTHLSSQASEWGAFHLLAEIDEESTVFRSLRQAGFAMYAWQRVWKLSAARESSPGDVWRSVETTDWVAVQNLHNQIVPALIQPVDALPKQAAGLVCSSEGNLQAYVAVNRGPKGVWLQPFVLPDSGCDSDKLAGLARLVSEWSRQPVYVCVRSYQTWLESVLEELGAEQGSRQAVMVKRLAKVIKETQEVPALEKALAKAKPAAPISRIDSDK